MDGAYRSATCKKADVAAAAATYSGCVRGSFRAWGSAEGAGLVELCKLCNAWVLSWCRGRCGCRRASSCLFKQAAVRSPVFNRYAVCAAPKKHFSGCLGLNLLLTP